jgi:hypothetical protein
MFANFRVFIFIIAVFGPRLGQALPVQPDAPVEQHTQEFVSEFLHQWSGPNAQALAYVRSVVNDPVTFYGKSMSRDTFMATQAAFAARWPERHYSADWSSEYHSCDAEKSVCQISGIETWNVFSPERRKSSIGSANFTFTLNYKKNYKTGTIIFTIAAESGSVIHSQEYDAVTDIDLLLKMPGKNNFAPPSANAGGSVQMVTEAALQAAGCVSQDGQTIQHQGCKPVFEKDVTSAFRTRERTVFEVTQATYDQTQDFAPPLSYCFVHTKSMQCEYGWFVGPIGGADQLNGASIISWPSVSDYPLLHATLYQEGLAGCGGLTDLVWAYDPADDKFRLLWNRLFNCHSGIKFKTKGALAGYMIAIDDNPTGRFPWPYGVEVYRFEPPDRLIKLLDFIGRAGQGGHYVTGPMDAVDVDMGEILERLAQAQSSR